MTRGTVVICKIVPVRRWRVRLTSNGWASSLDRGSATPTVRPWFALAGEAGLLGWVGRVFPPCWRVNPRSVTPTESARLCVLAWIWRSWVLRGGVGVVQNWLAFAMARLG